MKIEILGVQVTSVSVSYLLDGELKSFPQPIVSDMRQAILSGIVGNAIGELRASAWEKEEEFAPDKEAGGVERLRASMLDELADLDVSSVLKTLEAFR